MPNDDSKNKIQVSRRRAAVINLFSNYAMVTISIINGIVLVPLYFHFFDLSIYGAWLASGGILGMLGVLEGGINLVLTQRLSLSYGEHNKQRFAEYAGTGILVVSTLAGIFTAVGITISAWVPAWVNTPAEQCSSIKSAFCMAVIGSGFVMVRQGMGSIIQAWLKPLFAGIAVVISLLAGIIALLAGLFSGWGVVSLGLSSLVSGMIGACLFGGYVCYTWRFMKYPRPVINRFALKDLIFTTLPVFAGRSGGVILNNCQTTIAAMFIGPSASAIFSLTRRVFDVCLMVLSPIGSSAFAGFAHASGNENYSKLRALTKDFFAIFSVIAAILLAGAVALNREFVSLWVGSDKFGGLLLSIIFCMLYVINTRLNLLGLLLTAFGVIGKTAWSSLITLAIQLPLMFFFLRKMGLVGMPLAEICSILLVSGWYLHLLMVKRLKLKSNQLSLIMVGLPSTLFAVLTGIAWSCFVKKPETWFMFICHSLTFGLLIVAITYCLNPKMRHMTASVLKRIRNILSKALTWRFATNRGVGKNL